MSKFPKNAMSTEKKAKSIDEAIELALAELGIERDRAEIEIIQEPAKGFLGIGAKEAVVKVSAKHNKPSRKKAEKASAPKEKKEKKEKKEIKEIKEKAAGTGSRVYDSASPAENAKNFITDVLSAMGIEATVTSQLLGDVVEVNIEGDNMGVVIGKRGDTLDSIQYLTSLVINQKSEDYIKVSIDTENYREKREEALSALANRLAAKVVRTGRKFALEPMNPYERRIIHSNLQKNEDVTTFSIGQEPYRKVVIAPKNSKPYPKRNSYDRKKSSREEEQSPKGGYNNQSYGESDENANGTVTYKADFKPQQHKAEYKNFEEYLAAHSKD